MDECFASALQEKPFTLRFSGELLGSRFQDSGGMIFEELPVENVKGRQSLLG
jgi:hypothetical protein